MKITIKGELYKVSKIIKPVKGDMIIITEKGVNDDEKEVEIFLPFYTAYKFYGQSLRGNTLLFVAYHCDEFGRLEYAEADCTTFLNYRQYKELMILIQKEPVSFIEHVKQVVNCENNDLTLWI